MSTESQKRSILHITDLHLSDIGGGSREFLRIGSYREYLRDMWDQMSPHIGGTVDIIVATGDFVDRGRTGHFEHAQSILIELARLAGVDKSRVVVCLGNHDIIRREELAGQHTAARAPFREFASQFGNGNCAKNSNRAALISFDNRLHCLMLDGTFGAMEPDIPGLLDTDAADELINEFVRAVPEDEILVVGSHYPISPFPDDFAIGSEGPDYVRRHFWIGAVDFKRRVARVRKRAPTLWLFGDVHHPDGYRQESDIHIITGRLGVSVPLPPKPESQLPRQARSVVLDQGDFRVCDVFTANFHQTSHLPQPQGGEWSVVPSPVRQTGLLYRSASMATNGADTEIAGSTRRVGMSEVSGVTATLLDQNLNDAIYERIRDESLYRMGRFRTSGSSDSLGWVSIGQILGSVSYLPRFCSASLAWLWKSFDIKPHRNGDTVLFLGIDCWGASVASLLAVACGSSSLCVAVRADGRYHTAGELVDSDVASATKRARIVVVVTDVIATGQSIASVYSRIQLADPDAVRAEQRWIALAVLVDANKKILEPCRFLAGLGAACLDIKLPSVPSETMPGDDIAPAVVSFS